MYTCLMRVFKPFWIYFGMEDSVFIPENCKKLDSKTGGHFQKLGVDKGPLVSKLEGHF
jgi:hypothetical protein